MWVYLLRAALVGIFGLDWPSSLVADLLRRLAGCLGGALFGLVRVQGGRASLGVHCLSGQPWWALVGWFPERVWRGLFGRVGGLHS